MADLIPWTTQQHRDVLTLSWDEWNEKYGDLRTQMAFIRRRQHLRKGTIPVEVPELGEPESEGDLSLVFSDKKEGDFNWREANKKIADWQEFKRSTSRSQDATNLVYQTGRKMRIITLADTHIGSWGTDHNLLERVTDEILSIPDLYIILAGDIVQMAIRMRGVLEMMDNALPPAMQVSYTNSWFSEIAHRVIMAGWGNHEARLEDQAGVNPIADIFREKCVYYSGIGHADITVDEQTYRIAMSHKFRGRSQLDPTYGPRTYLTREGIDREIAIAGDSHVPGIIKFAFGNEQRVAVNTGSIQTNSGYGKRYFSLTTHPVFPVFVLDNEEHYITPYWSIGEMQRQMGY